MTGVEGEVLEAAQVAVQMILLDGGRLKGHAVFAEASEEAAERVAVGDDRLDGSPFNLAAQEVEVHELGQGRIAGPGFYI